MIFDCLGVLFDLDGTLVDSLPAVDHSWTRFCFLHGLDPEVVLPAIHGKKAVDSIRQWLPDLDADEQNVILRGYEVADSSTVRAFPGALEFFDSLPALQRLVVTSGTRDVAWARLTASGLPAEDRYVTGEQVVRGKPHADPFVEGAHRLGLAPGQCVAFEDTAAGVQSAKAAGCTTISFRSDVGADAKFDDWSQLSAVVVGPTIRISLMPLR